MITKRNLTILEDIRKRERLIGDIGRRKTMNNVFNEFV